MERMRFLSVVLASVILAAVPSVLTAQSKQDMKAVKKEAKRLENEGWRTLRSLSIQEQLAIQREYDRNEEEWVIGVGKSEGDVFEAAHPNAVYSAKLGVVDKLEHEITAEAQNNVVNQQGVGTKSGGTFTAESRSLAVQSISRFKTLLEMYHRMPNGRVEVEVHMAVNKTSAKSRLEELLKAAEEQSAGNADNSKNDGTSFDDFTRNTVQNYLAFRNRVINDYVNNLRQNRKAAIFDRQVEKPKDREVMPRKYDKRDERQESRVIDGDEMVIKSVAPTPQPKPLVHIQDNGLTEGSGIFTFYGTPLSVRWGNVSEMKLPNLSGQTLANAYSKLADGTYDNLLHDCLNLRKERQLCDWAYYRMLVVMTEKACGRGTNEAVMLQGFLLSMSGYAVRFATDAENTRLYLLVKVDGYLYDYAQYKLNGEYFSLLTTKKRPAAMRFSDCSMKGEQAMSMQMIQPPLLDKDMRNGHHIVSVNYGLDITPSANQNLMDFFSDYPNSYDGQYVPTRWATYANVQLSQEVQDQLYPKLRQLINNLPKQNAVEILLSIVQPKVFEYGYDSLIWKYDRAFFAEETLFYPLADCEDHAILFARLVRDLVGLDVALVYMPNHLAAAVCLGGEVAGSKFLLDGRQFVFADPTWPSGPLGKMTPEEHAIPKKDFRLIMLR